jgi:TATA-box binding protein (TBP) (component of TFIID and TFIIIB)
LTHLAVNTDKPYFPVKPDFCAIFPSDQTLRRKFVGIFSLWEEGGIIYPLVSAGFPFSVFQKDSTRTERFPFLEGALTLPTVGMEGSFPEIDWDTLDFLVFQQQTIHPPLNHQCVCNLTCYIYYDLKQKTRENDLDCVKFCQKLPNARYIPKLFAPIIHKTYSNHVTHTLFPTGKLGCTGATTFEQMILSGQWFRYLLSLAGYEIKSMWYKPCNHVLTSYVPHPINLYKLRQEYLNASSYDPKNFTGLRFNKHMDFKCGATLFDTGSFIISGGEKISDCLDIEKIVRERAMQFPLETLSTTPAQRNKVRRRHYL